MRDCKSITILRHAFYSFHSTSSRLHKIAHATGVGAVTFLLHAMYLRLQYFDGSVYAVLSNMGTVNLANETNAA